jgi:UDP-GlcNAc3NAcA epimerase
MKKILAIVGARPQFIKHAPIEMAFRDFLHLVTIHTGQHYDHNMSAVFFEELKIKKPDYTLSTGSHNHGVQTGKMMQEIEPIVEQEMPDAVLVYGDTNSTLAGALVGSKMNIPVIHIEAGLRSFNKKMPEEINRILTDHVSSLFFTSTQQAVENLRQESITKNVYLTGDIMCDMVKIAEKIIPKNSDSLPYYYATIHRPSNTDDPKQLTQILQIFNQLNHPVKFALHPRTQKKMTKFGLSTAAYPNINFLKPVAYFDNICLLQYAKRLLTDSGGMQKEAYILGVPCVTLRRETEWVKTLKNGWNQLIYEDLTKLFSAVEIIPNTYISDLYGDGHAAETIRNHTLDFFKNNPAQ